MASKMKVRRPQGFAAMDGEKQRAIASMGGRAIPKEKRSFSQNRELAAESGRKGGLEKQRRLRESQ